MKLSRLRSQSGSSPLGRSLGVSGESPLEAGTTAGPAPSPSSSATLPMTHVAASPVSTRSRDVRLVAADASSSGRIAFTPGSREEWINALKAAGQFIDLSGVKYEVEQGLSPIDEVDISRMQGSKWMI